MLDYAVFYLFITEIIQKNAFHEGGRMEVYLGKITP